MDDYLTKPVKMEALKGALKRWGRTRAESERQDNSRLCGLGSPRHG
jgi:response regulator of citrate/malate metabolism